METCVVVEYKVIQERWVSEEILKSLGSRYYNTSNFINNH